MRNTLLTAVVMLIATLQSWSQTSDVIQYYIAYDVSGSVGNTDVNDNLENSLFRLLNINKSDVTNKKANYERAISFNLYTYGAKLDKKEYNAYQKDKSKIHLEEIAKSTKRNKNEMSSDLKSALSAILETIKSTKSRSSTGIFIFTDGTFQEGDLPIESSDNITSYKEKVDKLLLELKMLVGPDKVFIIQTSQGFARFEFANKITLPHNTTDSIAVSADYLWVDARRSVSSPLYSEALERFIQQANATISTNRNLPLASEQEVIITIQEIANTYKRINNTEIKDYKNSDSNSQQKANHQVTTIGDRKKLTPLTNIIELTTQKTLTRQEIVSLKEWLKVLKYDSDSKSDETIDSLDLNREKEQALQSLYQNMVNRKSIGASENETVEPIKLSLAYQKAPATAVSELVTQAKGWENFEQNLVLGMADYLIKRSKMELTYTFIEHMEEYVFKRDTNITLILPATSHFIGKKDQSYDLLALKDVVKKDVVDLPNNILRHADKFVNNDNLYSFWVYMQLYNSLMNQGSLENSFTNLHNILNDTSKDSPNYEIVQRIKNSATGKAMIMSINLIHYLNKNNFSAIYSEFNNDKDLEEMSAMLFALSIDTDNLIQVSNMSTIRKEVSKVYADYRAVVVQLANLKKLINAAPTADFDGYRKYQKDMLMDILKQIASLLTSGAEIVRFVKLTTDKDTLTKTDQSINDNNRFLLVNSLNNGIDAWFNLKQENYTQAMFNLVEGLLPTGQNESNSMRTLLLASGEIASAKSTEEISNAIARHTLPVASHKIKKAEGTTFMIGAYVGISGSYYIQKNAVNREWGIPIIAAIGPEISRGKDSKKSYSLMVTLLDLGNIIHYRFKGSDGPSDDISLARIFSPGLLLSCSPYKKIPLAFTFSTMMNPVRTQLGVTLDMPLFSFPKWNKK